jgi:glyoxylase-like metal-dependent hydrolase (beta-lactamase superfamily II)
LNPAARFSFNPQLSNAMLPLEDLFTDVINKAQRGLGISDAALAEKALVSLEAINAVKSGAIDPAVLTQIASILGLHAASLIAMANQDWQPQPVELEGLLQFNTPYEDYSVNAYLIFDPATKVAAAFDTGSDASGMMKAIVELGLTRGSIFITHTHPDHIADLSTLCPDEIAPIFSCKNEPWPGTQLFDYGTTFQLGDLEIETRQTTGHSRGGVTYIINGLAKPVAIVGDALFASSMGGGVVSFADALKTNREQIFTLPEDTIICPGHGPMTTVGEEKVHNPFYPEFK